ncbi:hypothetical protein GN244_ATG01730 [Phytophthora infestans]|uniref:Uncharacterized protein n=1 Tax=Phytophthora infestans TaxID=4787 RepID=A0A833T3L2_PHYIN|nr:hypothetical protein GN244_ATG01730 [Phytophthora infestans]
MSGAGGLVENVLQGQGFTRSKMEELERVENAMEDYTKWIRTLYARNVEGSRQRPPHQTNRPIWMPSVPVYL